MWIEEITTKSGALRYKFCERFMDPVTGQVKKVSVTLDKNTTISRKKAKDLLAAKAPAAFAPAQLTLGQVIKLYNAAQIQELKDSTTVRNRRQMKALERILGSSTPVNRITAGYINQRFAETGESNSRINERLTRLKAMLRWAYKNDYVSDIGFLAKLAPRPDQTRKEKLLEKYMEPHELAAVLDAMTSQPKWALLTRFLCLSGLRIGEAAALTVEDVGSEYIAVTKTYNNEVGLIPTPKTDASNRDVYIQPELAACIKEIRQLIRMEKLRFGYHSDLFLPSCSGGYLHYDAFRKYLGDKTQAAIGRRLTPQACRHTMTSLFAGAGVPLETISRRLGHEDSGVTRKIYFHITEKLKERDNDIVRAVSVL